MPPTSFSGRENVSVLGEPHTHVLTVALFCHGEFLVCRLHHMLYALWVNLTRETDHNGCYNFSGKCTFHILTGPPQKQTSEIQPVRKLWTACI